MSRRPWIGVDLDGTLAHYYEGWNEGKIGEPVPLMLMRVRMWLGKGQMVKIFTARVSEPDPALKKKIIADIEAWCMKHLGQTLPVTCCKDFAMTDLWDDRCHRVEVNTGREL